MNATDKMKILNQLPKGPFPSLVRLSTASFDGREYMNSGGIQFFGPDEYCDKVNKLLSYHNNEYKSNGIDYFEHIELSVTDDNQIEMRCDDKFVILPIEAIESWAQDLQNHCNGYANDFGDDIIDLIDGIVMEEWPDVDNR